MRLPVVSLVVVQLAGGHRRLAGRVAYEMKFAERFGGQTELELAMPTNGLSLPPRRRLLFRDKLPPSRSLSKRLYQSTVTRTHGVFGLCPLAWCSFGVTSTITGRGRIDQAARVGRLTRGSSPIGAMLSRVM